MGDMMVSMKKNILSIFTIIILLVVAVGLKSVADTMKQMNAEPTPTPTPSVEVTPSPSASPVTEVIDTEGRVMGPQELVLKVGGVEETAGVIIRLDAISADSRCPSDVTCIQAGKVDADITFAVDEYISATTTISSDKVSRAIKGYEVSISKVSPVKNSKESITPDQYEITFIITPTISEPIAPI